MNDDTSKILRIFGTRVRQLRYAQGWKQEDLAAQLDSRLTRSAISYIETGKKSPSLETVIQLSRALGVEPAALLLQPGADPRHSAANAILACPGKGSACCVQSLCLSCQGVRPLENLGEKNNEHLGVLGCSLEEESEPEGACAVGRG